MYVVTTPELGRWPFCVNTLLEKTSIYDLCQKPLPLGMFYEWAKKLFEQGAGLFHDQVASTRPDTSQCGNTNIATGLRLTSIACVAAAIAYHFISGNEDFRETMP